jgi:hypothetical protein
VGQPQESLVAEEKRLAEQPAVSAAVAAAAAEPVPAVAAGPDQQMQATGFERTRTRKAAREHLEEAATGVVVVWYE